MIESTKMKMSLQRIFSVTVLFYLSLLLIPDKAFILVNIGVYLGILFWEFRDSKTVLVLSYMALVPLLTGKFFPIDLVSATELHLLGRPFGVAADITVTGREGIVFAMLLILIWQRVKERRGFKIRGLLGTALCILPVALIVSAFVGSLIPGVSMLHALFYVEPFIIYAFMTRRFFPVHYPVLLSVIMAAVFFESLIIIIQYIKGGTLGFVVESFPGYIPRDLSTDGNNMVRLGGTYLHANAAAHYLLFSLLLMLPAFFDPAIYASTFVVAPAILGFVALLVTGSRSAWLAWGIGMLCFYLFAKRWQLKVVIDPQLSRLRWVVIGFLLVVVAVLVVPRIASTVHTLEPYGSSTGRLGLIREAWEVIRSYPVFGVGLSVDVYAFYRRSQSLHTLLPMYFPEPVHNGFIQLLMASGLVGFVPYLLVVVAFVRELLWDVERVFGKKKIYAAAIFAAFLGSIVNAQLQPLLPDFAVCIIMLMALKSGTTGYRRSDRRHPASPSFGSRGLRTQKIHA